ncbi:MAG: hypothetical protein OEV42_09765 [Deltaproteobacteria bacterium]|nr:hypothetical protein [Deltaproteobacteria bacterium]
MILEAIFESWHIGDGNYPPLKTGDKVNLSFELEERGIKTITETNEYFMRSQGNADYEFSGIVLRNYGQENNEYILVVDTGGFKFYICSNKVSEFKAGDQVAGEGTLLLDHYIWVEFLNDYKNPPDLFYNLTVDQIRKVKIPEKFIYRHKNGKSMPTRVDMNEANDIEIEELKTMEGQPFDEEFYIVKFDDSGLEGVRIAKTFI